MTVFAFLLSLTALILQCILVPKMAILAFAPFIAWTTLKHSHIRALWLCASSGAIIDLLSEDPMGLHALNYTLCSVLLWPISKHFFHDATLHLSLLGGVVSLISTILQLSLLFLFDRRVPFEGKWVLVDLVGMPIIDMLYTFVWFAAPLAMFAALRQLWVVFWLKKKNLSPT